MLLPYLRRIIIEPLYDRFTGSPKQRYWGKLEKTQYLTENVLVEKQWKRLKSILEFAYANNTFYRKRFNSVGVIPSDIKVPIDISKLPILSKEQIRNNTIDMISHGFTPEKLLKFKTGGSTGKPLNIYITEECSELRNACAIRHNRWTGWEVGEPIAAVWGSPKLPKGIKMKLKNWLLQPIIYLDTMSVTEESVLQFRRDWEKIKPTMLFGHAHSIYVFAQYVRRLSIKSIKPKSIISSSMMLLPHERATIEKVFGVRVFDRYGCEEVSLIASECEMHKGMHLNIEHLFVEFLKDNGEYSTPGEPGRIIVTDLVNVAMPLIRYQIEDIGVPTNRKCTCGRGLPLMENVEGRVADFLIKKDGAKVAGISLIERTLTVIPGIQQMQIIQESLDRIVLKVVKNTDFSEVNSEKLLKEFSYIFGRDVNIEITFVNDIPPEPSGKYRFSISNIKSNLE